jgi:hypothetical protein
VFEVKLQERERVTHSFVNDSNNNVIYYDKKAITLKLSSKSRRASGIHHIPDDTRCTPASNIPDTQPTVPCDFHTPNIHRFVLVMKFDVQIEQLRVRRMR